MKVCILLPCARNYHFNSFLQRESVLLATVLSFTVVFSIIAFFLIGVDGTRGDHFIQRNCMMCKIPLFI